MTPPGPHVLTIAQPYALPHAPILNTLDEVRLVCKYFPVGATLEGDSGTAETALAALPWHGSWISLVMASRTRLTQRRAHFYCTEEHR